MIPWRNLRRFFYKTLKQPVYAARVLKKRFKAYLYYSLGEGRGSEPEAITFFLTHRCNLRCRMCGQWGEGGVTRRQSPQYIQSELSMGELTSVIDDVSPFKPNITLFGGEPLLSPNCIKIIKYIKEKGMHCLMITNGFRLEDMAEEVVESGLDELNVSLDGGAELHDRIRGMEGLFNKIMGGFKKVNYYKTGKKRKNPLINLQCTITKYNYRNLEQLLDVADEANADSLTFHNLIFLDRETLNRQKELDNLLGCSSSDWEGFISEPGIDTGLLCEKMEKILSGKYDFMVDFYPNFSQKSLMKYYGNPAHELSGNAGRCLSPWVVAYIFPDGEVRPCLNCSYSYGNVKKMVFTEIWNSEEALRFRRTLKEKKIFPVCVRCTELYRY